MSVGFLLPFGIYPMVFSIFVDVLASLGRCDFPIFQVLKVICLMNICAWHNTM
jgi:hypothetical protein